MTQAIFKTKANPVDLLAFSVYELHGDRTFHIPIKNNKIILVGVNGLGKTTIITILYRLLSRQWNKLLDFNFEKIALHFSNESILITRSDIEAGLFDWTRIRRIFPPYILNHLKRNPDLIPLLMKPNKTAAETANLAKELDIHVSTIDRISQLADQSQADLFGPDTLHKQPSALSLASDYLSSGITQQVLYLPTYRRIERDLKTIFPKLEEQVRRFHKAVEHRTSGAVHYIELVEFGMEDVEAKFDSTINTLKEIARTELNAVVGSYLREIIRGEVTTEDTSTIRRLDDTTIARILNRVEERTLNKDEKQRLRDIIIRIKLRPNKHPSNDDAYIARFFSKLVTLDRVLSARESSIKSFVEVCSRYLQGKFFSYDEQNYKISLQLDSGRNISLSDLSSGEKQIVSLFAHLHLEQQANYAVIIDEPELSLSVDWQRRLLPDIVNSGRCAFLAAATHSPYVFDNGLESYAQDLAECVEVRR